MTSELDLLSDLITEGKQSKRADTIAKAQKKITAERDKTPLPDGPPIRRDIYQQLEWRALSVTLVIVETTCAYCNEVHRSPNPSLFIERYHRRHGRHLVEAHNFNLLPEAEILALPRRVETLNRTSLYCHNCFFTQGESLCLTPTLEPLHSSQPTFFSDIPCVPQDSAIPSPLTLWSSSSALTSGTSSN